MRRTGGGAQRCDAGAGAGAEGMHDVVQPRRHAKNQHTPYALHHNADSALQRPAYAFTVL